MKQTFNRMSKYRTIPALAVYNGELYYSSFDDTVGKIYGASTYDEVAKRWDMINNLVVYKLELLDIYVNMSYDKCTINKKFILIIWLLVGGAL